MWRREIVTDILSGNFTRGDFFAQRSEFGKTARGCESVEDKIRLNVRKRARVET
jgi:hypothetical protein